MPRKSRIQQLSICYHLFNRGINRQAIFRSDADRKVFTDLVREYKERCGARVYHWAWMENHYHMLVEIEFKQLRIFAGGIQQSYVQYFHKRHNTCGIFWQGRYKSPPVECTDEYMGRCGRYIERNPVVAEIVQHAWAYPWSSAAYYAMAVNDQLTDANIHTGADRMTEHEREVYREGLSCREDDSWGTNDMTGGVIGSPEFATRFKRKSGRHCRKCGNKRAR
jgi:putative transposase